MGNDTWYPMFLENHDQPRSINHFLPENADRIDGGKALATVLLTMRGTPFIMQGEELGFVNVEWPSIDNYNDISTKNHYKFAIGEGYSEEEALDGVHHFSRDSARTPMHWDTSRHAGFTKGEPWIPVHDDYKTYNVASEKKDKDSVLNWYIALAKLRKEHPELIEGDYKELFPDSDQIYAYTRENDSEKMTVLVNLSTKKAEYDAACVSDAEQVLGSKGETKPGTLEPLEAVIFCNK